MTHSDVTEFSGHCLCGQVRFHGSFDASCGLALCHCSQCRRWSGHVWSGLSPLTLVIEAAPTLRWYRSSDVAQRGFCGDCGASLFWQRLGSDVIEVAPGAIDGPTGLRAQRHIFVADKGDYYDIADGLPQE